MSGPKLANTAEVGNGILADAIKKSIAFYSFLTAKANHPRAILVR
jgi:hypothetical protein